MIIQNFETLFLPVTPNDSYIYLPKERFLDGRKISYIIPLSGGSYHGIPIVSDLQNYYIDIFNNKSQIYNKMNLVSLIVYNINKIDSIIDFDLTKIEIKTKENTAKYLAICVVYCTENKMPNTPTNNIIQLNSNGSGIVKLSEIGGYQLKNKRIRKIETVGLYSKSCFLTIRTKDNNNNLYNIPTELLFENEQISDKDLYFDNIIIDPDNSYINMNGQNNISLIFKY